MVRDGCTRDYAMCVLRSPSIWCRSLEDPATGVPGKREGCRNGMSRNSGEQSPKGWEMGKKRE